MFASMEPKIRFKTATQLGRFDVQRIAAIEIIQAEWRLKIARKRSITLYYFLPLLIFSQNA